MSIKYWWNSERVGRVEEGTSQDYCPTNGDAVLYALFWCSYALIIYLLGAIK